MCMDSGNIGNSSNGVGDLNSRGTEGRIVYTRRPRKKNPAPKPSSESDPPSARPDDSSDPRCTTTTEPTDVSASGAQAKDAGYSRNSSGEQAIDKDLDSSLHNQRLNEGSGYANAQQQSDDVQNLKTPSPLHGTKKLPHTTFGEQENNDQPNTIDVTGAQGDELVQVSPRTTSGNGQEANHSNVGVKPLVTTLVEDDKVRYSLFPETPRSDIEDLRRKLEYELHQVRLLGERVDTKKARLASSHNGSSNSHLGISRSYVGGQDLSMRGYGNIQPQQGVLDHVVDHRTLMRMNSAVGMVGQHGPRPMGLARVNSDVGATRNLEPRLYNRQLSVSVTQNNHHEYSEKEKRTPKANQFYRESDFLLGKDRLPPESNKRLKPNNGRKLGAVAGFGHDKNRNQVLKSCSNLLQKLMKHKFGWVFNVPVDAKALGLADYHFIIKHPMDLGTIKNRLSQNFYNSPTEFAEDVRLVFQNAMTYNPKGQDVHLMAEELSQIFEERWAVIETEYNPYWNYQMYPDAGLPTPTSRKVVPQSNFALGAVPGSNPGFLPATAQANVHAYGAPPMSSLARTESMTARIAFDPKIQRPHMIRTPAPPKPKAKDPNKRDMTEDEKQKLSSNLQGLPADKIDAIVQIIKRRNTALSQNNEEIEVDIDNVDAETLWELDRFVTNFKKSVSKHKKKAELQAKKIANQSVAPINTSLAAQVQIASSGIEKGDERPRADGENRSNIGSRSSSSSSSSSDSGSSSDSDSDSSSADGSDGGNSPKT